MNRENLEEIRARLLNEERVQHMVRVRAYEIYQMRGGQPGWEAHDWLQAEGEVLAFLIANEFNRHDEEQPQRDGAQPSAIAEAPPASSGATPVKTKVSKRSAPKKTASPKTSTRKPEPKLKTKPARKASPNKESDR